MKIGVLVERLFFVLSFLYSYFQLFSLSKISYQSSSVNHEKELKEQYDLYQQSSTDLYNQLMDMSDDEFEKLSSANSKFELTKEQKVKYKYVTKTIDKVSKNKNKTK